MPPSAPHPPRIKPVQLPDLDQATAPPGRADVRELERYDDLDLTGSDLQSTSFTECAFARIRLDGAALRGSRLHQVIIGELDSASLSAPRSSWREVEIAGARIGSAELYESTWRSVSVTGSKINYVNARTANWVDVVFADCVLDELDLSNATAERLVFIGVRIGTLTTTGGPSLTSTSAEPACRWSTAWPGWPAPGSTRVSCKPWRPCWPPSSESPSGDGWLLIGSILLVTRQ